MGDPFRQWRPPTPFPVVVRYWPGQRDPDVLWTMPFLCDDDGQVIVYCAVGPAGKPVAAHLIAHIDFRGLPRDAIVQVVTEVDTSGVSVYGVPDHTPN